MDLENMSMENLEKLKLSVQIEIERKLKQSKAETVEVPLSEYKKFAKICSIPGCMEKKNPHMNCRCIHPIFCDKHLDEWHKSEIFRQEYRNL